MCMRVGYFPFSTWNLCFCGCQLQYYLVRENKTQFEETTKKMNPYILFCVCACVSRRNRNGFATNVRVKSECLEHCWMLIHFVSMDTLQFKYATEIRNSMFVLLIIRPTSTSSIKCWLNRSKIINFVAARKLFI